MLTCSPFSLQAFDSPTRVNVSIPAMVAEQEDETHEPNGRESTRLDDDIDDHFEEDDLSEIQWT